MVALHAPLYGERAAKGVRGWKRYATVRLAPHTAFPPLNASYISLNSPSTVLSSAVCCGPAPPSLPSAPVGAPLVAPAVGPLIDRRAPPPCCTVWVSTWASRCSPPSEVGRYSPAPKKMSGPSVTARAARDWQRRAASGPRASVRHAPSQRRPRCRLNPRPPPVCRPVICRRCSPIRERCRGSHWRAPGKTVATLSDLPKLNLEFLVNV